MAHLQTFCLQCDNFAFFFFLYKSPCPSCTVSEEQCLYQIYLDELYGGLQKPNDEEKKKYAKLHFLFYFFIFF